MTTKKVLTITLTGPAGCGKSLIGGLICKLLHDRGADTDHPDRTIAAGMDTGIDLSGFAVVLREEAPTLTFEAPGHSLAHLPKDVLSRIRALDIPIQRVRGVMIWPDSGLLRVEHWVSGIRRTTEQRQETAEEYAAWKASESKAKPEADPMPPVGPLDDDNARHLNPGDIVRYRGGTRNYQVQQVAVQALPWITLRGDPTGYHNPGKFDFVARPGVWMPYTGSENPVSGLGVRVKEASGVEFTPGPIMQWDNAKRAMGRVVVAFMVVPEAAANSTHGRVTIGDTDHVIDMPDPRSPASLKAFWDTVAAHYRSERASDTAITVTIAGPAGAGKTRFGEYLLRALSDYGSTLGKTQDVVEQNIRRFRESEEAGRPVYVGQFEGSSLLLVTRTVAPAPIA